MKVTEQKKISEETTTKLFQEEEWKAENGKTYRVRIYGVATRKEDWRDETTAWSITITNKQNPEDRFNYTEEKQGGTDTLCRCGVLGRAWEARNKHNDERPAEPMMADDATPETKLRDLIDKDDYQYEEIPEDMTVGQLWEKMKQGTPYYEICPVDSVIRETHFIAIAAAHNIDYNEPYENWLDH